MRNQSGSDDNADKSAESIRDERREIEKYAEERNAIVRKLLEQSRLQEDEKERIANELAEKDEKLQEAQAELSRLKRRRSIELMRRHRGMHSIVEGGVVEFTKDVVLPKLNLDRLMRRSPAFIRREFDRLTEKLPRGYLADLEKHAFYRDGLTDEGVRFLKSLAESEQY